MFDTIDVLVSLDYNFRTRYLWKLSPDSWDLRVWSFSTHDDRVLEVQCSILYNCLRALSLGDSNRRNMNRRAVHGTIVCSWMNEFSRLHTGHIYTLYSLLLELSYSNLVWILLRSTRVPFSSIRLERRAINWAHNLKKFTNLHAIQSLGQIDLLTRRDNSLFRA
jgi:hypothetical protein